MLLILGQPGIGKSTLITWIAANFTDKADDILVYRFASDLRDFDWQSARLLNRILEKLGFNYEDLNRKTIILDGLDEVSINNRREVLDGLYDNLIYENSIKEFSLIITCRENYVQERDRNKGTYIILQPWDETQIRSFRNVFEEKTKIGISENTLKKIIESKDILGIPLILYMVLALNISIEKEGSIVDVYDKIFSLDGGIYDRCIDNKRFADKHRIGEIKEQIHQISKDIAVWMFENNSEEANIPQIEYQKICNRVMRKQNKSKEIEQDFLIGNFFKLVKHCEGIETEQLYFVHRTIYEYFVVETIYSSICNAIRISKAKLAKVLGSLLKGNSLSSEILEYLKYKIRKSELKDSFEIINTTFKLMLQDGMTYYTNKCYKNVIQCEMIVFTNMLELLHLWKRDYYIFDDSIYKFLKYNVDTRLNLKGLRITTEIPSGNRHYKMVKGANLNGIDLRGVDLSKADLRGAYLYKTDLSNAVLNEANLSNANLDNAILKGAHIDYSVWHYDDIVNVRSQLKNAIFSYIFIEGGSTGLRTLSREEMFPDEIVDSQY